MRQVPDRGIDEDDVETAEVRRACAEEWSGRLRSVERQPSGLVQGTPCFASTTISVLAGPSWKSETLSPFSGSPA